MSGLLEGRRGLIVGASSGIGRASAKLFAEEGADIVIVARRNERLDELVAEYQSIGENITGQAIAVDGGYTIPGQRG